MSDLSRAAALEAAERPLEAMTAYRELVEGGEGTLEEHLSFAVLLWITTDFGFACFHDIPDEVVRDAYAEALKVLDLAEEKFGTHNEISFWRVYFPYITLGAEAQVDRAVELLRQGPSRVPAFHAFAQLGAAFADEARALLVESSPPRSERQRYVVSVLESCFNLHCLDPGGGASPGDRG